MFDLLGSFGVGFLWGYFAHAWQTRRVRPIRLLRHGMIAPGMPAIQAVIANEWQAGLQAWTLWAEYTGLSEQAMVQGGVCSSRGYRRYAGVLKSAGILVAYERSRTHYAPGWCGAKVRSFLRREKLSLPFPPQPPPVIYPFRPLRPTADSAVGRR